MFKAVMGAALAGVFALPGSAVAQDYPTRPVTMVIPFAAGGPTDVLGRVVGGAHERNCSASKWWSRTSAAPAA